MTTRLFKLNKKSLLDIVNEVKKRPCLWNTENEYYNNRGRVAIAWEEVTTTLNLPEALVRAKWKSMRDIFKRELKRCKYNRHGDFEYTGKWRHLKTMLFLRKPHQGPDCLTNVDEDDPKDNISNSIGPNIKQEIPVIANINNRDTEESEENISFETSNIFSADFQDQDPLPNDRRRSTDEDYDMMFLKSLVPYFRELDPVKKLRIRSKIQEIILNEISDQGALMIVQ